MSEPATDDASPADTPTDRLSALFEAHADRLYRLARRLAASKDDALDLVQEAGNYTQAEAARIANGMRLR